MTGGSGVLVSIDVNRAHPDVVLTGTNDGRVWRTDNGGATWTDITAGLPSRGINDVATDPTDPNRAFAVVGGFNTAHLWEWTTTTGWTFRGPELPNVPTNTVKLISGTDIVVGNDTGVWRSTDGGATFVPFMAGLPQGTVVTDLEFNPLQNVLTLGSYGRGAWQTQIGPPQPLILLSDAAEPLLELDGDGDDKVEPGETWSAAVPLRNAGGVIARNVSARLSTPSQGVQILTPIQSYGDVESGAIALPIERFTFAVEPGFTCGETITFDLLDITSNDPVVDHGEAVEVVAVEVLDATLPGPVVAAVEDDFDPEPSQTWVSESIQPGLPPCAGLPYFDEWGVVSKDAAHGNSYHAGNGPGDTYSPRSFSWLYLGGKDSQGGVGIDIPADAIEATLTMEHWFDTFQGSDGGQVVIDTSNNGQDVYETLTPIEGYSAGVIASANCNGLEGLPAFHGNSGGWVTNTFDLTEYRGQRVWLAFVFASDRRPTTREGWYVDDLQLNVELPGDAVLPGRGLAEHDRDVPAARPCRRRRRSSLGRDLQRGGPRNGRLRDPCGFARRSAGQRLFARAGGDRL